MLAGSEACGAGAAAGLTLLRAGVRCFGLFATPELGWLVAADGLLTGIADGGLMAAAAMEAVAVGATAAGAISSLLLVAAADGIQRV